LILNNYLPYLAKRMILCNTKIMNEPLEKYCRVIFIPIFFMLVVLSFDSVYSFEFQPLSPKAMSMGGAGVASAEGSFAPYFNPALLAVYEDKKEFHLSGGFGLRENNMADHIDSLYEMDITESLDRIAQSAPFLSDIDRMLVTETKDILNSLSDGNGLQGMPFTTFGLQYNNFGFGIFGMSEASGYANVDPNRLDIIVEYEGYYWKYDELENTLDEVTKEDYIAHSIEYALNQKLTYLQLKGLAYSEIPLSYAYRFDSKYGTFNIGGSVKIMPGLTYDQRIDIDTESGQLEDELRDAEKYDTGWGVDLGFLYKHPKLKDLSFGLVAKNLNTPRFDTITGDTIKVRPQVRFGMAHTFFEKKLELALDMDLTKNKTLIPGVESQFIGGGFGYNPADWFSIRGGIMRNMHESDDGTILTGGLGFVISYLEIDISAQYSTEKGEFKGNDIPAFGWLQVGLIYRL